MSAVASVSTPGVLPTQTPRSVQALTSMLLKPTAKLLTTLSRGALSRNGPSTASVSSDTRPSHSATFWRSTAAGGGNWSGQISASQTSLISFSPASGMRRVTNTLDLTDMAVVLGLLGEDCCGDQLNASKAGSASIIPAGVGAGITILKKNAAEVSTGLNLSTRENEVHFCTFAIALPVRFVLRLRPVPCWQSRPRRWNT